MNRDIRSFFSVKKAKKPVEDNDSDVIPESPKLPTVNKKKQSRKRRQIQEDSDEEIFSPPKINKNEPKPALKEVKAVDIFGSAPIKRSKPIVKKSKKETETGIHSDEEFEKSLLQLDEVDNSVCSKLLLKNNIVSKVDIIDKSKEQSIKHIDLKDNLNPTSINKKDKESIVYKKGENNHTNLEKIPVSKNPNLRHRKVNRKDKKNLDTMKTDQQIVDTTVHDSNDKSTEEIIQKENESTSQKRNEDEIDHDQTTIPDKKSKEKNQDSNDNSSKQITKNEKESTSHKRKLDKCDKDMNIDEKAEKIRKEKVDFSEFLINEETNFDTDKSNEPKQKRAKLDKSLNDSVLTDEERHERKRHSAALYKNYLNRSGPKHLGSKEIPEGLPGCLKNCAFLLTGVLDSFERDEVIAAIMKYGGRVKPGISKKVTHVIAGEDAGPAKLAKAEELGIKIINEDDFLKMIKDSMVGRNTFHFKEIKKENKPEMKESNVKESTLGLSIDTKETDVSSTTVLNKEPKIEKDANEVPQKISNPADNSNLMWVDKYKPTILRQIIGQHGERSNVIKLSSWLTQWYVNRKAKIPKPSPWARDDNGAYYKAALLSGPPGVGKTTTVSLVCKELGFDMVEFNASDTRSKTLIRSQIGELLSTTSLSAYARGSTGKGAVSKKHVLVMDEVDGMAGNEDRGGLQELISLIKSTSVPVICMCNDRSSEKMRTLVNYCYDLRFERPRVNQIMCAMLSICYKEGVKVPNTVITQLIEAAGRDVRQTLHMLSVWVADSNLMDGDRLKQEAGKVKKDIKMGPWEAIRRVFSADEHQKMSIHDKSDLFFADYNIMPLYVQENYLNVVPHKHGKTAYSKRETLERLSRAADSISSGDLVDARIRRKQSWNLLPVQAMFSSVIPGHEMEGHIAGQIQFPGWLGKNSRANKMRRLAQEIHAHTRLSTSGSKSSIFLDYSTHLRDAILSPLIQDKIEGIERSLRVLESYNLIREDIDSLVELSQWPGKSNPTALIEPRVKAALTRTYNKTASALPYAPGAVKKGARGIEDSENSQEDYDEVEVDSDPENDTLIKKVKPKEKAGPNNASGTGKKSASSSQSKGNNGAKSNTKR